MSYSVKFVAFCVLVLMMQLKSRGNVVVENRSGVTVAICQEYPPKVVATIKPNESYNSVGEGNFLVREVGRDSEHRAFFRGTETRTIVIYPRESVYVVKGPNGGALDIDGASGKISSLSDRSDGNGTSWRQTDRGNGYYSLQNVHSNGFLDIDGDSFGVVMMERNYSPTGGRDWKLEARGEAFLLVNRYWTEKKGEKVVLTVGPDQIPRVEVYANQASALWTVAPK